MSIFSLSVSRAMPILSKPNSSSSSFSGLLGFGNNKQTSVIECSSRPQKKGTAHHMKTRPKKSQPWDIRRKPTVYAPLPPLPPEWTLVTDAAAAQDNPNNTIASSAQEQESE